MTTTPESVRLAKHVARLLSCSRKDAETYIEGGWVRVDGAVVETPQFRVTDRQRVELDPGARLDPVLPVTLLLHHQATEPAVQAQDPVAAGLHEASRWKGQQGFARVLQRHFMHQHEVGPLERGASGLRVWSQEPRVLRRFAQDAALLEHEFVVQVHGDVAADQLQRLRRLPEAGAHAPAAVKASIGSKQDGRTGLRMAIKGYGMGQVGRLCAAAGLELAGMRRIRIGRVAMAALPPGQWRYLGLGERF